MQFNTLVACRQLVAYKFTANNAVMVKAPDGTSTNLTFPSVFGVNTNGLSTSEVAANFDFGLGTVVYFNRSKWRCCHCGDWVVLGSAKISQGATSRS